MYEDSDDEDFGTTRPCPNCKSDVYEDAPQCPNCGEYVTEDFRSPFANKSWWFQVLCVIAIILLILAFI